MEPKKPEAKQIYNTEPFNSYLKSSLTDQEKQKDSEWRKTINFQGKIYTISKERDTNYLFLDINGVNSIKVYLGKTTFMDENKPFVPFNDYQILEYFKKESGSKLFQLQTKNLNKMEILDLCEKGNGETIKLKYSPFLCELNENIFKEKNEKKKLKDLRLQDLSLFYSEYFPLIENNTEGFEYIESDERREFFDSIQKKVKYNYILPIELYGPSGIGKSTSLLAFQKTIEMKSAYFNLNSIFHLKDNNKMIKMILYESMSLFDNYGLFSKLKENIMNKNHDSPWDIIKNVINFSSENNKEGFLIILDQFKEQYGDSKFKSSEKIDSLLLNDYSFLKIIKCSSMNDTDVKDNFLKILNKTNYIYIGKLFQIDKLDEKEKLYFGNVSLFHYLYLNSKKDFFDFIEFEKKIIKSDIKKSIPDSSNLLKVISLITNIMKSDELLDEQEMKKNLVTIPLKYILVSKKEKNGKIFYTLDYPCLLIKIIFEELIVEELKYLNETPGIKELRGLIGGIFEIICHFALLSNKLENFALDSKNLFYIEKNLYNQKEIENNWKKNETDSQKMKDLQSFYLRPTSTNSELYDSVIIFKQNNKYDAYLLQMSISKNQGKKIVSRENHYRAIEKFKKKMKVVYNIDIENVYFSYIFYYDDINKEDVIECIRLSLDYFYYSVEQDQFFQLKVEERKQNKPDNKQRFIDEEKMLSSPINHLTFNSLSNMKEIKINIKFIKSKEELYDDKAIMKFLNQKRKAQNNSFILGDIKPIKNIIHKNKDIKLEFYEEKGKLYNILRFFNDSEYFCLIKDYDKNIYGIYNKSTFLYNHEEKTFSPISDNLGTKLFINKTQVEFEIFSIV